MYFVFLNSAVRFLITSYSSILLVLSFLSHLLISFNNDTVFGGSKIGAVTVGIRAYVLQKHLGFVIVRERIFTKNYFF